ncbi:MAG: PSD1 and planctomycete cytochrome C domain-containing protein [Pirellulales bacterium]|nr:PSD1 and planctomycete cytochrome C domain-containing protein [Pirellulales bacterium]
MIGPGRLVRRFVLAAALVRPLAAMGDELDYAREIQPILLQHCVACHGADEQNGSLRLDTATGLAAGGSSGPAIVAQRPEASRLYLAITHQGDATPMPPEDQPPLAPEEIERIRQWIAAGAVLPEGADAESTAANSRALHWAFQPIRPRPLPAVADAAWPRTGIDAFVLARLEQAQIAPSPPADAATLLRRVYLDLVGLPPTADQLEEFLTDTRPDAYERLVERLLASPHYGERWGRHWLDAARYADSDGYNIDAPRSIWKYRDWVIDALNRDLPFDQFIVEQYAGDLLPGANPEQCTATGFHRNTLFNGEGGTDREQFRVEAVVDRVATTGTVLLGLTLGCARCHDHKYDPITQREFYELFAYLNQDDEPLLELPTAEQAGQLAVLRPQVADVRRQLDKLDAEFDARQTAWEAALTMEDKGRLPQNVRDIIYNPPEKRDEAQRKVVADYYRRMDDAYRGLTDQYAALLAQQPAVQTTMVLRQRAEPRVTHVHLRGDFLRPGREVVPGTPEVLPPSHPLDPARPTRLDLARWLVAPDNPLTPRVTVNRVWQHYFGTGLVETENDFGTQGTPPSHPELLDWLAHQWIEAGWSFKWLHRTIVCSATYRQSSHTRAELAETDPQNRLLARQARIRLDAETIRDCALAASGLLSPKLGGPSVFPHQPDGVMQLTQVSRAWEVSPGEDRYRRTLYTYLWRSTPHPLLKTFDAPDTTTACTRRPRSNTPLQALMLLNDAGMFEAAAALANRLQAAPSGSDEERIQLAFRWALARRPASAESARVVRLLEQERRAAAVDSALAAVEVPAAWTATDSQPAALGLSDAQQQAIERAAWTAVARVLLNLEEFITRE